MSEPTLHDVERRLATLTVWEGPTPRLWKRALASRPQPGLLEVLQRLLASPLPRPAMAVAAVLVLGVLVTFAVLPQLGGVERSYRLGKDLAPSPAGRLLYGKSYEHDARSPASRSSLSGLHDGSFPDASNPPSLGPGRLSIQELPAAPADRQVVRKATIELVTPDVRAAFLKAAHLVSEASGEYVQDSSLTGEGKSAAANLTLRVAADRLSTVLAGLRDLGAVHSEASTGEDATEQMVDLEARLRNEQTAERELLELMQARQDAPLKDILDLRTTISGIRESIERLQAQRERLARLVSLATVLVIIRADPEPAKPQEGSLLDYFGSTISSSWDRGLRFLTDTAAALVRVLVGGAVWWVLAVVLLVWARRRARAALAARGGGVASPAPAA